MGDTNVDAVAIYHIHDDDRITPIVALDYDVEPAMRHRLLQALAGRG
ncbi:hypothetical protein ACFTWF_15995 [Rhodococcus sp. NPDC056960]